jgi:hypothetical protein
MQARRAVLYDSRAARAVTTRADPHWPEPSLIHGRPGTVGAAA